MTNEIERMYELTKELFETGEHFKNEFVKMYDTNFRNKDEAKKIN